MKHDFGDIRLFNEAIAADRINPPIEDYLRSAGLSDSEIAEVRSIFNVYCAAIENAPDAGLPDIASATPADASPGVTSVN